MAQRGGTRKQWRPLHVATSDAGAAPLVPHPCFIIHHTPTHITQSIKLGHHMKCQRTLKAANPTHLNSKHEFSIIIKSTNHKVQQSISLHVWTSKCQHIMTKIYYQHRNRTQWCIRILYNATLTPNLQDRDKIVCQYFFPFLKLELGNYCVSSIA